MTILTSWNKKYWSFAKNGFHSFVLLCGSLTRRLANNCHICAIRLQCRQTRRWEQGSKFYYFLLWQCTSRITVLDTSRITVLDHNVVRGRHPNSVGKHVGLKPMPSDLFTDYLDSWVLSFPLREPGFCFLMGGGGSVANIWLRSSDLSFPSVPTNARTNEHLGMCHGSGSSEVRLELRDATAEGLHFLNSWRGGHLSWRSFFAFLFISRKTWENACHLFQE